MTVTVGQSDIERTYLQSVNRIISMIGESVVGTLNNPTRRISMAMTAVQDARDEVFYKTMWEFRRAFMRVELVESQMWYEVPADFHKMATGLSLNRTEVSNLTYKTYESLLKSYPNLRAFPPGSGVVDINTVGQLSAQSETFGESHTYCLVNGYIGLMLVPDADFVQLESYLYASYWKQAMSLNSDNDDIGLPRNLWGPANLLASATLKKALEYSDWEADYRIGQRDLDREISGGKLDPTDEEIYNDPIINYNE